MTRQAIERPQAQAPAGSAAIRTTGLRKSFGGGRTGRGGKARPGAAVVEAVRGIDLTVRTGEIFGFLGPNGAGKTTTVRMLSTLLAPDGGSAVVAGHDLVEEPESIRRRIGYVGQHGGLNPMTRVRANLVLQARLFGLPMSAARVRADEMLARFDLADLADRPVATLSGGQARRLSLAVGLTHAPQLLFLDEPTLGLDPRARASLWEEIRQLREQGSTVFLTTHYLEEVDNLCDRLAIIDGGRIVVEGSPGELKRSLSADVLRLRLPDGAPSLEPELTELPLVQSVRGDGRTLRVYVKDGERALPAVLRAAERAGVAIEGVALGKPSLDDVFLRHTGRAPGEGGGAANSAAAGSVVGESREV
ncbi:ATP-binding cassette domain-containing protein [Embleya sp. NBC_00888]|uniref:ATP-binding cassette domain-containing protein n=1 Tax=Embleya sp. NBC_00888 TaxID=2975960 RepID=UPI0038642C24|nr:ATP-binding cassette domain-containing protein [Embleya sp. NBC_00888]